jgi:integrase
MASIRTYTTKSGERRYAVRWRDSAGQSHFKRVPGPKKNAQKVKAQIEGRLALGPLHEEPPELFGDFLIGWLDRYKQRVRPSTLKRRREALRALVALEEAHSDPFGLAAMRLDRIPTAAMEDAISVIGERAPRQAQLALETVKLALRNARERGQSVDPGLFLIAPPEGDEREPIFLTWNGVLELASWLPEQISRIVPVAALTGAREGELFALREDDVDLADETLLVVTTGSNRRGRTKTRGSKRTIDLPPLAAQFLREQLLARWHTSGRLVFPAPEGGVWNKDNFTARVFRPAVARAAEKHRREHGVRSDEATPFDGLTFHDLRHTCASLMIAAANQAGAGQAVTIKSIAEQLGHTDGGVLVLRRYGHLFKGTRRHVALALDKYVRASSTGHADAASPSELTPRAK